MDADWGHLYILMLISAPFRLPLSLETWLLLLGQAVKHTRLQRFRVIPLQPDAGRILVEGLATPISSPHAAHMAGIGMVYQHFMLIDALTVAENVILGQSKRIWLSPQKAVQQVADLARRYGLAIDPAERVSALSMGERQRVEILKLLHRRSRA